MSARTRYEVQLGSGSLEVVDLADGEVVLFWDVAGRTRRRMEEALRHDLARLEPEPFLERWRTMSPARF